MDFRLTTPALASNCWPATPQELVNEAFTKTRGQLENLSGVIISETQPAVDDQDKEWVRIDSNGREHGRFIFGAGTWNRENPEPASPSNLARRLFVGTEAQVWSYDGGDGTDPGISIPTATTGAMWEVDELVAGRFLAAVGDVPGSDPLAVVAPGIAVTNTSAAVMLAANQVAAHTHALDADSSIVDGDNINVVDSGGGSDVGLQIGASGNASQDMSVQASDPGTQEPVPIVPPAWGFYVIKRTGRTHYTA